MNIDECMKKLHPNYEDLGVEEKKRADWDKYMMKQMYPDDLEEIFSRPNFFRTFNDAKINKYWGAIKESVDKYVKGKDYERDFFILSIDDIEENLIAIKEVENEIEYTDSEKVWLAINIDQIWDEVLPNELESNVKEYHKRLMIMNWPEIGSELLGTYVGDYFVEKGIDKRTLEERMKAVYHSERTRIYTNALYPDAEIGEKRGKFSEEGVDKYFEKIEKTEDFIYENIEKIDNELIKANVKLCGIIGKEQGKDLIQRAIDKVKSDLEKNNEQETSLSGKRQEKKALSTKALAIKEQIEALEKVKSQTKGE